MLRDFVLEIGTEEIPARFMAGALREIEIKATKVFKKERIIYKSLAAFGTPRRLTLYVKDLQDVGEALVEERKGPSAKVAFDQNGSPTQAAHGFARGQNVNTQDLVVKHTSSGEYVFAVVKEAGQDIRELFPKILPELILSLDFPKPMRWGYSNIKFIRPIRWLLSLYGDEVINIEIEGIRSGDFTSGHRFLGKEKVKITDAGSYFMQLEEEYVIIDQNKRRELVWSQIEQTAILEEGRVIPDERLLEEINFLLEYPTALCGKFSESYLELPKEVLITVMKEHQKYFPMWDKEGKLLAKFITVRNGDRNYLDIVTEGNQKVLEARLNDAGFFYKEDVKVSLEQKTELLKAVVFQESLGTMLQKVSRIKKLVEWLATDLQVPNQKKELFTRTAHLAKADLVSNMVYEFPELQGTMGYYYALYDNESEEVALAVKEHYQPRFSGDDVPSTMAGTVVAIADKIDTICGCFAVDIRPTGSGDPYALRRQAQGICFIITKNQLEIDLFGLITQSLQHYRAQGLNFDYVEVNNSILEFFKQRLAGLMEEQGFKYDVVNCVLQSSWSNIVDTLAKAEALMRFKENKRYSELITSYTRASNLAKNSLTGLVDEKLFVEDTERILWEKYREMQRNTAVLWDNRSYGEVLERYNTLKTYIDDYFEKTMVMDEDENIKNNRLAMLKMLVDYLAPFGDLSKLLSR